MKQVHPDLHILHQWLHEDIGSGDLTAGIIPEDVKAYGSVRTREAMVLCGTEWFTETLRLVDSSLAITWHFTDGDSISADQCLCEFHGNARHLLSAERTALNILQTMSATATCASLYAEAVRGLPVRILDTRKTLPGLREVQKYAVSCGGCHNHRHGLYDAILIKENHIVAAGSIANALTIARKQHPDVLIEIEVESLDELEQALAHGCNRILLDNFDLDTLKMAVVTTAGKAELEASGNIDLGNIRDVAATGVDYISIGALTKHVRAIDLSMRLRTRQAGN